MGGAGPPPRSRRAPGGGRGAPPHPRPPPAPSPLPIRRPGRAAGGWTGARPRPPRSGAPAPAWRVALAESTIGRLREVGVGFLEGVRARFGGRGAVLGGWQGRVPPLSASRSRSDGAAFVPLGALAVRRAGLGPGASCASFAVSSCGRTRTTRSPTWVRSGRSPSLGPPTPRGSSWRRSALRLSSPTRLSGSARVCS